MAGRYNPKNKRDRFRYTQLLRKYASKATKAYSLSEIKQKVSIPFVFKFEKDLLSL